ncbi:sensor histidine kinase [Microbacterium mangrovi]|uniref:sensor histidine kinase n=1 Tax=Microbacterium mangrovi TaxID=1348253 RepID=UPI00068B9F06|nr:histidine kinase [Microbacterium mangrovi]
MNRSLSVAAAVFAVATEAVAVALSPVGPARWNEVAVAVAIAAYAAVGVLILWHRPRHPIGTIAAIVAPVWAVGEALVAWSAIMLAPSAGSDAAPVGAALASVIGSTLRGLPWLVVVLWLPVRFPSGLPASTRLQKATERLALVTIAVFAVAQLFSPTLTDVRFATIRNPIGVPVAWGPAADLALAVAPLLATVGILLSLACLISTYRHGGPLDRQQTAVFGVAFLLPVSAFVVTFVGETPPWLFGLSSVVLPVAIGVSVLQRRLYDIPLLADRTLTYAGLVIAISVLYAVVVGGVGMLLRQPDAQWLPWLGAAVIAVSFAPLRDALQGAANRLVYGQWSRPEEVISRTAGRLRDAAGTAGLLQSLVDELAAGLRLAHVGVRDASGAVLAAHGPETAEQDELALVAFGERVGTLVWTRRPLRARDRELLRELAGQLGSVVHASGLLDAVRASQERIVVAGEEERRRLRRDLHDGLGPALAGLTLRVDAVRNDVRDGRSPVDIEGQLLAVRGGIQSTVVDVRRIVEGLRPPAIDELGLVDAVREFAAGLRGGGLDIRIDADPLPPLSAAAEVAIYRIIQEALNNVAGHAHAAHADVSLRVDAAEVVVTIVDDGTGILAPRADGVGLHSMHERAATLGGDLTVDPREGIGTTVRARIPLDEHADRPRREAVAR